MNRYLPYFCFVVVSFLFVLPGHSQIAPEQHEKYRDLSPRKLAKLQSNLNSVSINKKEGISYKYLQLTYQGVPLDGMLAIQVLKAREKAFYSTLPEIDALPEAFQFDNKVADNLQKDAVQNLYSGAVFEESLQNSSLPRKARYSCGSKTIETQYEFVYKKHQGILVPAYKIDVVPQKIRLGHRIYYHAATGELLSEHELFYTCNHGGHSAETDNEKEFNALHAVQEKARETMLGNDGEYYCTALPDKSPYDGLSMKTEAADFIASPYGWHDIDSTEGPDTESLEGNHVIVFHNDTVPTGEGRVFDQVPDFDQAPETYAKASAANVFYVSNQLHDIFYNNGFDDASGNFQLHNYYGDGEGGDRLEVIIQDTTFNNNAYFSPTLEGQVPQMVFSQWDGKLRDEYLSITEPASLAGSYESGVAVDGALPPLTPLTAELLLSEDALSPIGDNCEEITTDLSDKIAFIRRGNCDFIDKINNAAQAGAVGVVFYSAGNQVFNFSAEGATIPSVLIGASAAIPILQAMKNGESVMVTLQRDTEIVQNRDGAFDNEVVAHEFGHGVSTRLVGGPNMNCLFSLEQGGEGWSDVFSLILTMTEENHDVEKRGVGGYSLGEEGTTIRTKYYSRNIEINDLTYSDVWASLESHAVGEVWASILWDLTLNMVDLHDFNPDLILGNAGNRKALYLIVEALKLTPCQPDFVSARDAILSADELLYNGEHHCMIWETFARRGVGYGAKPTNLVAIFEPGVESFDLPPQCDSGIEISKRMSDYALSGDTITVEIIAKNKNESPESSLQFSDVIPDYCSFVTGSGSIPLSEGGGNIVNTEDIAIGANSQLNFTYQLVLDSDVGSKILQADSIDENSVDKLSFSALSEEGKAAIEISADDAFTGEHSVIIHTDHNQEEYAVTLIEPLKIDHLQAPLLRFSHKYDLSNSYIGAIVEYSTDNGFTWQDLGEHGFKNSYHGKLGQPIFLAERPLGFTHRRDWYSSFFDLTALKDSPLLLRWKLGTGNQGVMDFSDDYYLDDIEIWDRVSSNSIACLSNANEEVCVEGHENGTIILSDLSVKTLENTNQQSGVFPNPGNGLLHYRSEVIPESIALYSADGRLLNTMDDIRLKAGQLDFGKMSPGLYILRFEYRGSTETHKIIIQ